MNLKAIENNANIVFSELSKYIDSLRSVLGKTKIVIGNDLAACKRDNCTVDKPCVICRSLRQLDEEIDGLLK